MFARIERAVVAAYPVDPRAEYPNISFADGWVGGAVGGVEYVIVAPTDVPQVSPTQNHVEGTPIRIDGVWTQTWNVTDATPEQIAERTASMAAFVRADRSARLAACDWTQLSDAPITAEQRATWAAYRQALREVPGQAGFPLNVTWPVTP